MSACEGRCGTALATAMRELDPYAPKATPDGPTHTAARCRRIRRFREALEKAFPGWRVSTWPWAGSKKLMTMIERIDGGEAARVMQIVCMEPPWAVGLDEPLWNAEEMRRKLAGRQP